MPSSEIDKTALPSIFKNHMVLQQDAEVDIWGWEKPGIKVLVRGSWNNKAVQTDTGSDSKWYVTLKTPYAGGPYRITIQGSDEIVIEDVLIGEVWLCSGQSNMEWSARMGIDNALREVRRAEYPDIHLFKVKRDSANLPQSDCNGKWLRCSSESMIDFSAVAYFFGRHLFKDLNIPIGLIDSSWDGTPIETWINPRIIMGDPEFLNAVEKFPELPWCPSDPGSTYNAMIVPIIPFNIAGVIWYQGETNTLNPIEYRRLFPALIQDWRREWEKELPFYYVQIGPYKYERPYVGVLIREAQFMSRSIPKTGMVVVSDIVAADDIHPKNKKDVGERLANWALSRTYGKKGIPVSGPLYRKMDVEGNRIRIFFDFAENGLLCKGQYLTHFQIACKDREFVDAKAEIDGSSIIVYSSHKVEPVAVRFAWSNSAIPNLFNVEGLPASCFRTDDWEVQF